VSRAGLDLTAFPQREIGIRGKREMLAVRTLVSAVELPAASIDDEHRPSAPGVKRQPVDAFLHVRAYRVRSRVAAGGRWIRTIGPPCDGRAIQDDELLARSRFSSWSARCLTGT
jgi:hypothetical protein